MTFVKETKQKQSSKQQVFVIHLISFMSSWLPQRLARKLDPQLQQEYKLIVKLCHNIVHRKTWKWIHSNSLMLFVLIFKKDMIRVNDNINYFSIIDVFQLRKSENRWSILGAHAFQIDFRLLCSPFYFCCFFIFKLRGKAFLHSQHVFG